MLGEIPRGASDGTCATGDDDIVEHAGVQRPVRDGRSIGEGSKQRTSVSPTRSAVSPKLPQYRRWRPTPRTGPSPTTAGPGLKVCSGCSNPMLRCIVQCLAGRRHRVRCVDLLGADGDQTYRWQRAPICIGQSSKPAPTIGECTGARRRRCAFEWARSPGSILGVPRSTQRSVSGCESLLRTVFEPARGEHRDRALRGDCRPATSASTAPSVPTANRNGQSGHRRQRFGVRLHRHRTHRSVRTDRRRRGSPPRSNPTGSQGQRPPR